MQKNSSHVLIGRRQVQRNVKLTSTSDYLAKWLTTGFNTNAREHDHLFFSYWHMLWDAIIEMFDICEQLLWQINRLALRTLA